MHFDPYILITSAMHAYTRTPLYDNAMARNWKKQRWTFPKKIALVTWIKTTTLMVQQKKRAHSTPMHFRGLSEQICSECCTKCTIDDAYYETLNNKSRLLLSLLITMYENVVFFCGKAKWCVCSAVTSTTIADNSTVAARHHRDVCSVHRNM